LQLSLGRLQLPLQPPLPELPPLVRQQLGHRQEPEPPEVIPPAVQAALVMLVRLQTSTRVTRVTKIVAAVGETGGEFGADAG
jgi:hypothetical protein